MLSSLYSNPGLKTVDSMLLYDLEAAGGDRDYIMHGSAAWSQFMVGARP